MNATFVLKHDEDVENPRDFDEGNIATFCLFHGRYNLPNETDLNSRDYSGWDEVAAKLRRMGAVVILPVYGYDHSGLFMSTQVEQDWWHFSWDGGQLGFIAVMGDHARKMMGWKVITPKRREQLIEQAKNELAVYDQWQRGETFYAIILDEDGYEVDTFGGFIGRDYAIQAVKEEYPEVVEQEERYW
jgi:hypothetical protein